METQLIEILQQSPTLAAFLFLTWMGSRWVEKQNEQWRDRYDGLCKSQAEQCERMQTMADSLNQTLGSVTGALERCAHSHEALARVQERR